MKKVIAKIILLLNLLCAAALVVSYLSIHISPATFALPAFFGLAYPYINLINILFVFFWLFTKPRYLLVSLITILAGYGLWDRYFQLRGESNEDINDVKVASYNVRHFVADEKGLETNADEVIDFLEEQNADIICLQEARLWKRDVFNLPRTVKKLKNINHYQFARSSKTYGQVTMTRYPIVKMEEIRFEDSFNLTICTDVVIDTDTVRIFNVHLRSYNIQWDDYHALEEIDIQAEESRKAMKKVALKLKEAFKRRAEQVDTIRQHIDDSPYPVIVCGDFNDTPVSYSYQTLSKNLLDAFVESGTGIGRTYVGRMPSFRIDYIFHSDEFKAANFETHNFGHSDHLPIVCNLEKVD